MSDALTYLVKARPDALGPYLQFLKRCGRHLDPKTRALISVITKVHSQTERGLHQYLKRALAEGCTPMEVLDALLMAFPALGLAKIVWAVDSILKAKVPGFELEALQGAPAQWHAVAELADIADGQARRIDCDGRSVFVHRSGDEIKVWDSRCPHESTDIPRLALEGSTLTCPKHGWTFDITSGACIRNGERPLHQFPSRVVDGRIEAAW